MKNCLVVFYSRTGMTHQVARDIALACGCDIEQIHDVHSRIGLPGYLRSVFEAIARRIPAIRPTVKNPADYTLTVVGTPVWAGNISAPVRSYLTQNKGRFNQLALFCTMGGSGGDKTLDRMAALCDKQPIATLVLTDRQIEGRQSSENIARFTSALAS